MLIMLLGTSLILISLPLCLSEHLFPTYKAPVPAFPQDNHPTTVAETGDHWLGFFELNRAIVGEQSMKYSAGRFIWWASAAEVVWLLYTVQSCLTITWSLAASIAYTITWSLAASIVHKNSFTLAAPLTLQLCHKPGLLYADAQLYSTWQADKAVSIFPQCTFTQCYWGIYYSFDYRL